jgi:hypothetical protein
MHFVQNGGYQTVRLDERRLPCKRHRTPSGIAAEIFGIIGASGTPFADDLPVFVPCGTSAYAKGSIESEQEQFHRAAYGVPDLETTPSRVSSHRAIWQFILRICPFAVRNLP